MGRGRIRLETALLVDLLKLPEDYRAIAAWSNDRGGISILVEHPDIPEVEASEPYPLLTPVYEAKQVRVDEFKEMKIEHFRPNSEGINETTTRPGKRKRE